MFRSGKHKFELMGNYINNQVFRNKSDNPWPGVAISVSLKVIGERAKGQAAK